MSLEPIAFWTMTTVMAVLSLAALWVPVNRLRRMTEGRTVAGRMFGAGLLAAALPMGTVLAYLALGSTLPTTGPDTPAATAQAQASAIQWETAGAPAPAFPTMPGANPMEIEAQSARRARDFPRAIAAFEKLAAQGAMSADLWADYADAIGASTSGLAQAEPQILRALALDPRHAKALWLLGSLQTEKGDHAAALATWDSLLAVLPPDSSDARLVADNRREAQNLLGQGGRTGAAGTASSWVWAPGAPAR